MKKMMLPMLVLFLASMATPLFAFEVTFNYHKNSLL
jgi:hypothetical protein